MEDVIVELEGVEKRRDSLVFGPVSLQIPQGYIVAIVGSNGSGKSTLLNMLMQTIHPDRGTIRLFGEPLKDPLQVSHRERIGYVPEKSWNEDDGETLQSIAAFMKHWYPTWDEKRYEKLVQKFEVNPKQRLGKMSKGMRRKCELIVGLVHRPELLLLDEPSSGLDPFAWKLLMDELRAYMEQGDSTIILASHIVEEIKRLADYIVFMHQGRFLGMEEKDSLLDDWKELWVESDEPIDNIPGAIASEPFAQGTKWITRHARVTEQTIKERGLRLIQARSLDLDEILMYYIEESKKAMK